MPATANFSYSSSKKKMLFSISGKVFNISSYVINPLLRPLTIRVSDRRFKASLFFSAPVSFLGFLDSFFFMTFFFAFFMGFFFGLWDFLFIFLFLFFFFIHMSYFFR